MNRAALILSRLPASTICVSTRNAISCSSSAPSMALLRSATPTLCGTPTHSYAHTHSPFNVNACAPFSSSATYTRASSSSSSSSFFSGSFSSLLSVALLSVSAAGVLLYQSQPNECVAAAAQPTPDAPTPAASSSSHSSSPSGSPPQSAVDAEVLHEGFDDLDDSPLEEKSESPFTNPNVAGVSYVTANDLLAYLQYQPNRVNGTKPVLLFVTEDGCSACARLKPVILQLAESAEETGLKQSVILATQDGDRNYSKTLFSKEEALAVPRIKLFLPAKSSDASFTAFEYDGKYNCVALSEWLAQRLGKDAKIPLEELKSACIKRDPQTVAKVSDASRASLTTDLLSSLYLRSPCGVQTTNYIISLMSRSYASSRETAAVSDKTLEQLFQEMNECAAKKAEATINYWKSIEDTAKENLDAIKEKNKNKKEKKD